jgi:hypothetical protein
VQRKQQKGIILTSWFPLIKRKLNLQSSINWKKGGKSSGKKREKEGGYTEFKEKYA